MRTLQFNSGAAVEITGGGVLTASNFTMGLVKLPLHGGTEGDLSYTAPNGVVVTSSTPTRFSTRGLFGISSLFDGAFPVDEADMGLSYWMGSANSGTLTFDFGAIANRNFSLIRVRPITRADTATNYTITTSDDGMAWTTVVSTVTNSAGVFSIVRDHAVLVTARFVRFNLTTTAVGASLAEIEFYTAPDGQATIINDSLALNSVVGGVVVQDSFRLNYPPAMEWRDAVAVSVTAAGRTMAYSGSGGQVGGAFSVGEILAGEVGFVEFRRPHSFQTDLTAGLGNINSSTAGSDIEYGISFPLNGFFSVMERGVGVTGWASYFSGDVFRVSVENNGRVYYWHNNRCVHISSVLPSYPLSADISMGGWQSNNIEGISFYKEPLGTQTSTATSPAYNMASAEEMTYSAVTFSPRVPNRSENLILPMLSNTNPSPLVASASSNSAAAWMAFGGPGGTWTATGTAGWLSLNWGNTTLIDGYTLMGHSTVNNNPRDWTFEGSTDGVTWAVLDTRSGSSAWVVGERRLFTFANAIAYHHYRINVSANNGGTALSIGQLEMSRTITTTATVEVNVSLDGGATWLGWTAVPNGSPVPNLPNNTSNARIQLRKTLHSSRGTISPSISNIAVHLVSAAGARSTVSPTTQIIAESIFGLLPATSTPVGTSIRYLVSFNNGSTWMRFDGVNWVQVSFLSAATDGMTVEQINSIPRARWLEVSSRRIRLAVGLISTVTGALPSISSVSFSASNSGAAAAPMAGSLRSGEGYMLGDIAVRGVRPRVLFTGAVVTPMAGSLRSGEVYAMADTAVRGARPRVLFAGAVVMPVAGRLIPSEYIDYAPLLFSGQRAVVRWAGASPGFGIAMPEGEVVVEFFRPRYLPNNWHPAVWNGQKENDQPLLK